MPLYSEIFTRKITKLVYHFFLIFQIFSRRRYVPIEERVHALCDDFLRYDGPESSEPVLPQESQETFSNIRTEFLTFRVEIFNSFCSNFSKIFCWTQKKVFIMLLTVTSENILKMGELNFYKHSEIPTLFLER